MHEAEEAEKKWLANVQFHGAFKDFFGAPFTVFRNGKECKVEFSKFINWFIKQCFPDEDLGEDELFEIFGLSDELFAEEREIGIEVDEFEGMFIGIEYGTFRRVFSTGDLDDKTKKLVRIYVADVFVPDYIIQKNILENPDVAEKVFRELLEDGPKDLNVHHFLVELLKQNKNMEGAKSEYQRLLELIPDDSLTLHNYAVLLADLDEFEEAEPLFKKAITLEPEDVVFRYSYADLLKHLKRDEDAEKELSTAKWLAGEAI